MSAGDDASRRLLIKLAGAVLVLLLLTSTVGIVSLRKAAQDQARDLARVEAWLAAADQARLAQVHFKIQVQEWKNILLRGHDAGDFQRYHAAMAREADQVRAALDGLGQRLSTLPQAPADTSALADEHQRLARNYATALAGRALLSAEAAREVDHQVRGQDRQLNQRLDGLAEQLRQRADQERLQAGAEAQARARRVETILLTGAGVTGLVLLGMLGVAVRRKPV